MSEVILSTVLMYRGDDQSRPVEPELSVDGVDKLFRGLKFPKLGTTFLYGHRNPAIRFFQAEAAERNLSSAVVDLNVEIGKWTRQKVDLSAEPETGLIHTKFLSDKRCKREVHDAVLASWVKEVGNERLADDTWPKGGTINPWLMDSVIADPRFSHLVVFAYTIHSAEVGEVQVATLFNRDAVTHIDGGYLLNETNLAF